MNFRSKSEFPFLIDYFEMISAIPRMSYHEEKIADFICEFASSRGFDFYRDPLNNVLVNVPATDGFEEREPIMLQGHIDMVCEKDSDIVHDFLCDGLDLFEEDGFIKARGTTLGGDDGIAIVIMLALMDGKIPQHPYCQCLFTTAEEVGLDGAKAFDYSKIVARRAINIDNSDESSLIVGCAGGVRTDVEAVIRYQEKCKSEAVKITVNGLGGGHSGENIGEGRQNANLIVADALRRILTETESELCSFCGGSKDNAIPRYAEAVLLTDDRNSVEIILREIEEKVKREIVACDAGFYIGCELLTFNNGKCFEKEFAISALDLVLGLKNGVLKMSDDIEGLVEFSRNFAVVTTDGETLRFTFSSRSAKDSQVEDSMSEIEKKAALICGKVTHRGRYPGWDYLGHSELAEEYIEAAKTVCDLDVRMTTIHAGLECGLMRRAIPELEMISCGANCPDLHSPLERLEIASLDRIFKVISYMLEK